MEWRTAKSSQVLKAILSCGWSIKRQRSSHKILSKAGWPNFTFAFHDREEIGPRMLARIAKHTGLRPDQF
ncbi:MAG: type II toxin-antitoxin system HicA family toxin [bacterium]|nr:type II toxin-antitoxin system HicA family toxin [bacterium]